VQCGSGPSSDFLAKVLGVDTPLFLCNTQFYSALSSLLLRKSHKRRRTCAVRDSSVGSVSVYDAGSVSSIPNEVMFSIAVSIMTLEAVKFRFIFNSLHLFIFLVFWPGNQRWVRCHTAESEDFNRPDSLVSDAENTDK
jgi:hypothetical protein